MEQIIMKQAFELYYLEMELVQQQEKLSSIFEKGYGIRSSLFILEYEKLSALTTRYMQLENAHNELLKEKYTYIGLSAGNGAAGEMAC